MYVIRLMALTTLIAGAFQLCQRLLVATVAGQARMRAGQGKTSLLVMIEMPAVPARRVVAGGALRSEGSLVRVIRLVATDAGRRGGGELKIVMTAFTGDGRMHAQQGKLRQVVIKPDMVSPARFVVTLLALLAKRFFVHVIFIVAGRATEILDGGMNVAQMTLFAADLLVGAV